MEVPAPALQLKSGFTASLRGAAERLGLLQGSQAQLRNRLPLVLIESDSSDHQTPLSYNMVMGEPQRPLKVAARKIKLEFVFGHLIMQKIGVNLLLILLKSVIRTTIDHLDMQ